MNDIKLYNGDCLEIMKTLDLNNACIVTDPPFNISSHYSDFNDNLPEYEYLNRLYELFNDIPFVIIHYPETIYKIASKIGKVPERVVSWVYNSNTARQHRDIAFIDIKPNFNKVKLQYKNINDKRIKQRIAEGKLGCKLYDWWNINQVKNVSKIKVGNKHPCVMPLEIMERIIGILPNDITIIDPFMGSGTTGVACKKLNRNFIGIELDKTYFEIAKDRIKKE